MIFILGYRGSYNDEIIITQESTENLSRNNDIRLLYVACWAISSFLCSHYEEWNLNSTCAQNEFNQTTNSIFNDTIRKRISPIIATVSRVEFDLIILCRLNCLICKQNYKIMFITFHWLWMYEENSNSVCSLMIQFIMIRVKCLYIAKSSVDRLQEWITY